MKKLYHRLLPLTGNYLLAFVGALTIGCIALAIGGTPALAQVASTTTVSLQGFMTDAVWPAVQVLAVPLVAFLATRIASWLKLQNDAAAFMRSIAQRRGRNVAAAESGVREAKSFTEDEALAQKLIDVLKRITRLYLDRIDVVNS